MEKLNKRVLRQIPISKDIKLSKSKKAKWYLNAYTYTTLLTKENILVVDAYSVDNNYLEYRIFMTKTDYITLDVDTDKWRTAKLTTILDTYICSYSKDYSSDYIKMVNNRAAVVIKDYFMKEMHPVQLIQYQQDHVNEERIKERDLKTTSRIDLAMAKVKDLPKDFDKWLEEEAMYNYRYLYYHYEKGKKKMNGYCSWCNSSVEVVEPRHDQKGICPCCGSEVTFKAYKKSSNVISDWDKAAIIQKYEQGFIIRYFEVHKRTNKLEHETKTTCFEYARDIYINGDELNRKVYEWTTFKQRYVRWCDYEGKRAFGRAVLYTNNLSKVMDRTIYKYSALKELARSKRGDRIHVESFLNYYPCNQYYEYLIKMGLTNLVKDLIEIEGYSAYKNEVNMKAKRVHEVLRVAKYDIPILQELNANLTGLRYVRYAREHGIKLEKEQIDFIQTYFKANLGTFTHYLQYTTVHKTIRYLTSNFTCMSKKAIYDKEREWGDYVHQAQELNYNIRDEFVLFPKNLTQAHYMATDLINEHNTAKQRKEANTKYDGIRTRQQELIDHYSMDYKNLMIRVPKDAAEIIREGQTLHHCVGGNNYLESMSKGVSIILFIRKVEDPDTPYFTMEVRGTSIQQYHGIYNDARNPVPKEVKEFVKVFKDRKLQISYQELTKKEEKKVG